ncbi:MAG: hypothetical protein FWE24_05285 [Defluviitaleaceae bacterium]|nr:hypothetical protein [Defluviitaleaceae bacterium]
MLPKNLISELSDEQLDELLVYTPDFSQTNLDNIKRLSLEKLNTAEIPLKRKTSMRKLTIIAAAILLLVTSTAVFATTGGLEQFLARFNPNFGEFAIAPLYPAYAIDQGIRIEVVGAQQIDNVLLVYTIMQDVSGENRITRHMSPDFEFYVDGERMSTGGGSGRPLHFDRTTNTSYTERILLGRDDMPKADTIELVINHINCFERSGPVHRAFEGEWVIEVNTSDLGIQPIVWIDVSVGNLYIEHMSLSPFGVQFLGTHTYGDISSFPHITVEIEFENRRRNYRFSSQGMGIGYDHFSLFSFADSPIDIDEVVAIIINGERIQAP